MRVKLRSLSGPWGVIVGIIVALVLVPTVAVATGVTVTEIKGAGGNKAEVTPAGELLTTGAPVSQSWTTSVTLASSNSQQTSNLGLPTPPSGYFDVVSQLDVTAFADDGTGIAITACSNQGCGTPLSPSVDVHGVIPESPAVPINVSSNFLTLVHNDGDSQVGILVSGYTEPCADDAAMCS